MRFEKGHKEATRQRIIETASKRFRKEGVEAVGIAGLMADAGLTHGGFYAHFGSKEELVREAMADALAGTRSRLHDAAEAHGLEGLIRHYLRPAHRDTPEAGCIVPSLVAEVARHPEQTRQAFTKRIEALLCLIEDYLPPAPAPVETRRARAIALLSLMVGALQLSRAVSNRTLSNQILENGVEAALRLAYGD